MTSMIMYPSCTSYEPIPFLLRRPFKCYVMKCGVGGVLNFHKKRFGGARLNVISVTRRCAFKFPEKVIHVLIAPYNGKSKLK